MKISDYVPKLYNKNLEMNNIIYSEEEELENNLKPSIDNSFKNTFAIIATETGIEQFEKLLNIEVDTTTEDLEIRRQRVIYRLTSHIPYTLEVLKIRLDDILGSENYELDYDFIQNMTLKITTLIPGKVWYDELISLMEQIIPVNIDWTVEIYSATWDLVKQYFTTWEDIYNENMTWQEVMDAEWST